MKKYNIGDAVIRVGDEVIKGFANGDMVSIKRDGSFVPTKKTGSVQIKLKQPYTVQRLRINDIRCPECGKNTIVSTDGDTPYNEGVRGGLKCQYCDLEVKPAFEQLRHDCIDSWNACWNRWLFKSFDRLVKNAEKNKGA